MKTIFQSLHRQQQNALKSVGAFLILGFISLTLITACGGGGASSEGEASGVVNISLTDAQGDFISYSVDVVSLSLTRANGTVVETLPVKTRIDFAQYTDMTEFLTAATVPAGLYVKGSMTLDYSNAEIWVEDANGDGIQVTNIVDSNGDTVTTQDMSVRLEDRSSLLIAPGIPMHLSLDFDLKASNTITFDNAGVPTQVVEPFMLAEVDIESNKIQRLRGPLKKVDVNAQRFEVYIRPFYHRIAAGPHRFGALDVLTSDETIFEIDNVSYQGQAGLQTLSESQALTAVIVKGALKFNPRRFEATEVYAGSSVPGGTLDVVKGSVIARSGNALTLRGATLMRADGSVVFNDNVTVNLAESTTVKKQLSMEMYNISDISVGQRLIVFGNITDNRPESLKVDASNGFARMLMSQVKGTVVTNDATPAFDLNLASINGRSIGIYDFTGTGTDVANDADVGNYEVETSVLDVSSFVAGTKVRVRGFARPFGMAPKDYTAATIIVPAPVQ